MQVHGVSRKEGHVSKSKLPRDRQVALHITRDSEQLYINSYTPERNTKGILNTVAVTLLKLWLLRLMRWAEEHHLDIHEVQGQQHPFNLP